jgi:Fibronectin type III domain/Chitobiase/beta-hexosaminidase C-terminal domain
MSRSSLTPTTIRRQARRRISRRAGIAAALTVTALGTAGAVVASADPPEFPNNLVVFPNRDFITIEGYEDYAGQQALIQVRRGTQVVGQATGTVSGGEVAFEINHPGGICWGEGAPNNLKVTPDIKAGDVVSIKIADQINDDTVVQDVAAGTGQANGNRVTITGHIGANVNGDRLEQRIVNPDLVDTVIGRRDIRALPGPVVTSDRGPYDSGVSIDRATESYTATYDLPSAAIASQVAGGGGERMMAWQLEDADGNRQGLTIAESGEPGGPGMGGCPAGPSDQGAPRPGEASAVRSADKKSIAVNWTPAESAPGSAPVTGYSVVAIGPADSTTNQRKQVGFVTPANATSSTIRDLDATTTYAVELRSMAGAKMSEPFVVDLAGAPVEPGGDPADTEAPPVSSNPAAVEGEVVQATSVRLASPDSSAQIFFTTNGDDVLDAGLPSDSARLFNGTAIPITAETTIKFAAFDDAGNYTLGEGTFAPSPPEPPTAPVLGGSTAGQETITARWSSPDTSITRYEVQLYKGTTDEKVGPAVSTAGTSHTFTSLVANEAYQFTVRAENPGGWSPTVRSGTLMPSALTDRITITQARWKRGDFRISGTGSQPGATITIRAGSATAAVIGTVAVGQPATPGANGTWELRLRNGTFANQRPAQVYAVSSGKGTAGPVATTAG